MDRACYTALPARGDNARGYNRNLRWRCGAISAGDVVASWLACYSLSALLTKVWPLQYLWVVRPLFSTLSLVQFSVTPTTSTLVLPIPFVAFVDSILVLFFFVISPTNTKSKHQTVRTASRPGLLFFHSPLLPSLSTWTFPYGG